MKKNTTFFVLFLFTFHAMLSQGIEFKHMDFNDALAKAKVEDKLIFIDFHTEWCGPCKKLAAGPFMEQKNGDFYNDNFINLKLDAEKEGTEAAKRYGVIAFPTLLFVNGDGEIVHQSVGVKYGDDMIGFGKEALNASTAKYSWAKLQEMFPNRQNDAPFLKLYFEKMKDFGADADVSLGIDAWLKVQTEFNESSPEMLSFLLDNKSDIYLGTRAEAIFNKNYEHFLTLANDRQKVALERFRLSVFLKTIAIARKNQNPERMRVVIDRFQEYNLKPKSGDNLATYKMDYYLFSKDYNSFKRLAEKYVDSLISLKSIKAIKLEDEHSYKRYAKNKVEGQDKATDVMLQLYKEGIIANDLVECIEETARNYFDFVATKRETKNLEDWIKYCDKLIPGKYSVNNLKADLLFRQGKIKEAIALKTIAINNMPFTVKKKVNYQHELDVMKQKQN